MTKAAITALGNGLLLGLLCIHGHYVWISSAGGHKHIWTCVARYAGPRPVIIFLAGATRSPSGRLLTLHLAVPYGGSRTSGTFCICTDPHAIRP
ncbi:hypothetical protein EDC04DRAFT_2794169 [Pisolithus marmoratus]|nr:hypothetical protein EDC04DRAFT_2794169 [Pisolithus marmoratus]